MTDFVWLSTTAKIYDIEYALAVDDLFLINSDYQRTPVHPSNIIELIGYHIFNNQTLARGLRINDLKYCNSSKRVLLKSITNELGLDDNMMF
jgi:hypothetical protein